MLANILASVGTKLLTEKLLVTLMFKTLEKLVAKTTNTIDDELVAEIKKAYYGEE